MSLSVSPSNVLLINKVFGFSPTDAITSATLTVTASGAWTVVCDPWLQCTPSSGTGNGTISVNVINDDRYLPKGTVFNRPDVGGYTGSVTVLSTTNGPFTVSVSYHVGYGDLIGAPLLSSEPVFSPTSEYFVGSDTVTLSADAGADIFYSTDGSYPTVPYTGAIGVTESTTILAVAIHPISVLAPSGVVTNNARSAVSGATYLATDAPPQQATPIFSLASGTYIGTQSGITITSSGADAIYYTTDGSTPTTGSTLYTGPISVSTSETVKALAVRTGYTNSAIGSATYTIVAAPALGFYSKMLGRDQSSDPINTTGATLLVAFVKSDSGSITPTDTYSNTWIPLTQSVGRVSVQMFYAVNPTTGVNHSVHATGEYAAMASFNSTALASPLVSGTDLSATGVFDALTLQAPSVSVSSYDIVITVMTMNNGTSVTPPALINESFTVFDTSDGVGPIGAYLIAPSTSYAPTWTITSAFTTNDTLVCNIAGFKHA